MSDDENMTCGLTLRERERLKASLEALPDTMPPRVVWQRIERQAQAEGLFRRRVAGRGLGWAAGSGIAAAVVLLALNMPPNGQEGPVVAEGAGTVPVYASDGSSPRATDLELKTIDALMTRSRGLERDLRRLPASPAVMRASTAAAIDRLERQIAAIDYQLNNPALNNVALNNQALNNSGSNYPGRRLTRRQQELLWRERVRLMNSLLKLRYAQLQRGAF